jgi:hypothetical protein
LKKSLLSIACILVCALLISCQKDNAENPTAVALAGSYKFISMEMNGLSISTATDGTDVERVETVTKYKTKNNSGTVTFTTSTLSSINLSYEIDTTLEVSYYTNGNLDDKIEFPLQFQIPPTSSTSSYKVVSTDSLYFSSGSMFVDGTATQATQASGARIKKEGDLLQLIVPTNSTTTENNQGVLVTSTHRGVGTITLQKL